jgi:hypothetical protein
MRRKIKSTQFLFSIVKSSKFVGANFCGWWGFYNISITLKYWINIEWNIGKYKDPLKRPP